MMIIKFTEVIELFIGNSESKGFSLLTLMIHTFARCSLRTVEKIQPHKYLLTLAS